MRGSITFAVIVICIAFAGCAMRSQTNDKNPTAITSKPATPTPMPPKPDLELQKQIAEIAKEGQGKVGVYAELIEAGQTVSLNSNEHFAMQSVVKVPVSMAVLQLVSDGKLNLDELIAVQKEDFVRPNSRSPIRDM